MKSVSSPADVSAQMAQLSLQTNGSTSNAAAAAANSIPTAVISPVTPVTTVNNNSSSTPRQRTGIPRYAIPYRRPDYKPSVDSSVQSPISPAVSETASGFQQATPRGRNGFRTESFGDDSLSSGFGGGASQRYGRAASVDPLRGDSESEHSSENQNRLSIFYPNDIPMREAFSSSGQPRRITSKIGSLKNAGYKPGGGNVKILDTKVDFSNAQSKCNSKANLKYKPGGGDIQIVDNKLSFKENSKPRVNSLANARHIPGGGNVKIFSEKLPWLKYNKPNLPPEEKAKINKHAPLAPDTPNEPIYTSRHPNAAS